jgi:hypothetical protein
MTTEKLDKYAELKEKLDNTNFMLDYSDFKDRDFEAAQKWLEYTDLNTFFTEQLALFYAIKLNHQDDLAVLVEAFKKPHRVGETGQALVNPERYSVAMDYMAKVKHLIYFDDLAERNKEHRERNSKTSNKN